jgi:hypothetical protein
LFELALWSGSLLFYYHLSHLQSFSPFNPSCAWCKSLVLILHSLCHAFIGASSETVSKPNQLIFAKSMNFSNLKFKPTWLRQFAMLALGWSMLGLMACETRIIKALC